MFRKVCPQITFAVHSFFTSCTRKKIPEQKSENSSDTQSNLLGKVWQLAMDLNAGFSNYGMFEAIGRRSLPASLKFTPCNKDVSLFENFLDEIESIARRKSVVFDRKALVVTQYSEQPDAWYFDEITPDLLETLAKLAFIKNEVLPVFRYSSIHTS